MFSFYIQDMPASNNTFFYMFQNLVPAREYEVSVAMRNAEGEGPTAAVRVSTPHLPACECHFSVFIPPSLFGVTSATDDKHTTLRLSTTIGITHYRNVFIVKNMVSLTFYLCQRLSSSSFELNSEAIFMEGDCSCRKLIFQKEKTNKVNSCCQCQLFVYFLISNNDRTRICPCTTHSYRYK